MNLIEGVKKYKSKKFMEAVVAGCAMIAYADGLVQTEEIVKLMEYLRIDERLKLFDSHQVMDIFNKYVEDFEFDLRLGREKAIRSIRKINKNHDEARLLILVCCAVGKADEKFTDSEKKVIRDICMIVGLKPAEFDLNQTDADYRRTEIISPPEPVIPPPVRKLPDMPDRMKNPPAQTKPSPAIPDWMRTPKLPSAAKQDQIPDWMRKHRKTSKKIRNPDHMKKSDSKKEPGIPDWMKKYP